MTPKTKLAEATAGKETSDCVCCGEPNQAGRYDGLPCCFPCYETGLLREWLDQHRREWKPNVELSDGGAKKQ